MKPSVPETGRIIKIENGTATVMLQGGESCRGCGAAEVGLCKAASAGNMSVLTVKNSIGARVGDVVTVGIAQKTQMKAFLFAFIVPFLSFLVGSAIGYVIGKEYSLPSLDVITGFASLLVSSWYFLKKLRKLDRSEPMVIKGIVSECRFTLDGKTVEEQRFEEFAAKSC